MMSEHPVLKFLSDTSFVCGHFSTLISWLYFFQFLFFLLRIKLIFVFFVQYLVFVNPVYLRKNIQDETEVNIKNLTQDSSR